MRIFTVLLLTIKLFLVNITNARNHQHIAKGNEVKVIHFGKTGRLELNLNKGMMQVYYNQAKIIGDAFSIVKNGKNVLSSKVYVQSQYQKYAIKDDFGNGSKHIVTYSRSGYPQMQQVFYTYPDKEYFFTEVILNGKTLSSNYMAPLVSNAVDIQAEGDNRVLFVPFDNDNFISYNAKPMQNELHNTSSEVGVFYENTSRKGLVTGSVEHETWKTGVATSGKGKILHQLTVWGGYTDEKVTRDTIAHGTLTGSTLRSPKIFVGFFDDWRLGMEVYGKANRIAEKPYIFNWTKPTPFGWNSWGVIQEKLSLDKAIAVTDFFSDSLKSFRNGNTAYIDLDSYWDNLISGGLEGDFNKLKKFADYCKSKGLEPGAYWAPFVDWGWKSKHIRRVEGSKYNFADIWTKANGSYHDIDGARALDPTHPGTRERIAYVVGKLKDCGFTMIKIDFLGHAAIESDAFFNPSVKTGMQAFKSGMEFLVDQLDNQMLVYAAISPNLATGRYAHTRRIACDAFQTIKHTRYTLNSLNYGWWQTYVYNFVDADHLVFGNKPAGSNRARLLSGLITGTLIMGDDFASSGPWTVSAKNLLQSEALLEIARNGKAFMPVEGNTGDKSSAQFVRVIGDHLYLAVFNFDEKDKVYNLPLSRIGLGGNRNYKVGELYRHTTVTVKDALAVSLNGEDAAIFKFTLPEKVKNPPIK